MEGLEFDYKQNFKKAHVVVLDRVAKTKFSNGTSDLNLIYLVNLAFYSSFFTCRGMILKGVTEVWSHFDLRVRSWSLINPSWNHYYWIFKTGLFQKISQYWHHKIKNTGGFAPTRGMFQNYRFCRPPGRPMPNVNSSVHALRSEIQLGPTIKISMGQINFFLNLNISHA